MNTFTVLFSIAGLGFRLELSHTIEIEKNFRPFLCPAAAPDIVARFIETDRLPMFSGELLFCNENFKVYPYASGCARLFHDAVRDDKPYALAVLNSEGGTVSVSYLAEERPMFAACRYCFSYIAFEDLLLSRNRLILHASFISSPFGGILFSGPSGIGKSTQAGLWETLEGSTVINGDKPILGRPNGTWMAYGSPYAGSSQCYVNESRPITAIVMLEQGSVCSICRLHQAEAFRRLYAQTIINAWNSAYVQRICELLADLSASVPVYHMVCTPDRWAVETLKAELRKGDR